jgi:mannose-6-phosphate isomerase-like protein (cupin superfamily)
MAASHDEVRAPPRKEQRMPVYGPGSWLNPATRPDGCGTSTAGRFTIPVEGGRFDRHQHDDDELWFIASGSARIVVDGVERDVAAGDIVLHPAGSSHDIVAVYEELRGFFTETGHPAGGRVGHLHADERDAAGHDVPRLPEPAEPIH